MAEDPDADDIQVAAQDDAEPSDETSSAENLELPRSGVGLAMAVGLLIVVALAGLVGWFGFGAYRSHRALENAQKQRALVVQTARQEALNITTVDYTQADADVQRILSSATGPFYDDFSKRSQPFIDIVKQQQSKSEGAVTEAGLESVHGDTAQVLVAGTVQTSTAAPPDQQLRAWRMRLSVQKIGDGAKVSNVEYVP